MKKKNKRNKGRVPKVSDKQLLDAFNEVCRTVGVVSRGFDYEAITAPIDGAKHDGTFQWAMRHRDGLGWMVVSGWRGCGCALSRWNGYVRTRWDFLLLLEAVAIGIHGHDYSYERRKKE